MEDALKEEPPPTLRAVKSRLGVKSESVIIYRFPSLTKAIADRHREYRKGCREKAKLALESALTEIPPPSVRQIARNVRYGLTRLYQHFPDLCHRVAANHIEYLRQRGIARKEKRKAELRQVISGLAAPGTLPSLSHIVQSPLVKNLVREDWGREYFEEVLNEMVLADKAEKS